MVGEFVYLGWVLSCFADNFRLFFLVLGQVGLEMDVLEEQPAFEIGVVVPKRSVKAEDCVEVLVNEFKKVGLIVERVLGVADEFIKVQFYFLFSFQYLQQTLSFRYLTFLNLM